MASVWIVIHWYNFVSTMTAAEEALVSMCDERARMLQDQFAFSVNHVHALAILRSTFHYQKNPSTMDQDTFAFYTGMTAFERPMLNGVAYAQRVLHSERSKFERYQDRTIQTMKQEPSSEQNEYAPEDRENILRARSTGKAVLTNPFRLLESNHLGVVLTLPVSRLGLPADATIEEHIEATTGYLGGAFDVESLVENLLRKLAGNQDIVVNDITNISNPLTMYGPEHSEGVQKRNVMVMEDCRKMEELKVQAEASDIAKSQDAERME